MKGHMMSTVPIWFSLIAIALIMCGACAIDAYSCDSQAVRMKLDSSWGPLQGCMVKTKNGWRPITAIRDIDP